MKLKSTTTNGFNLRIINSLMHNAFTCPDCKLNMPTSIPDEHMGVSPPGFYRGRRNNPGLWKTGKIYWSQFGWLRHCAHPYFIRQTERTVREPTLLFERGEVVVSLVHIIHIMGWVVTMTRLTVVLSSSTFHLFNHLLISNLPVHQSCLPVNLKLLI